MPNVKFSALPVQASIATTDNVLFLKDPGTLPVASTVPFSALKNSLGNFLWGRSGTVLSPVTAGDDVNLGAGDISVTDANLSGNEIYSGSTFSINSNKADGADNTVLNLCSGGTSSISRGAFLSLFGADVPTYNLRLGINTTLPEFSIHALSTAQTSLALESFGAEPNYPVLYGRRSHGALGAESAVTSGEHLLVLGGRGYQPSGWPTGSNAAVFLKAMENFTNAAQGTAITFETTPIGSTNASRAQSWGMYNPTSSSVELQFGNSSTASTTAFIKGARADGSDDGILKLCGGGDADVTRGAYVQINGNEIDNGRVIVSTGNSASGSILFNTSGSNRWKMLGNASASVTDLTYGAAGLGAVVATIRGAQADGSDDTTLNLCGGGAVGTSRGASVTLKGNDVGGAGAGGGITYEAGTGTTAYNTFNQAIGVGGAPNANAQLDVQSTTKAFMPPRMTSAQKAAVSSPAAGMVVYDTDLNKLCVYDGSAWTVADGYGKIVFTIGDGDLVITTGLKKAIEVTQNCTITGWKILSDDPATIAGDIVIDIWHKAYGAGYPPLVANTLIDTGSGGVKPTVVASNTSAASVSVAHWTTALSAGDILRFNVDSVHLFKAVTLILEVTLT